MEKKLLFASLLVFAGVIFLSFVLKMRSSNQIEEAGFTAGFFQNNNELIKQGEHLVLIAGCHDCHTPKKMTAKGPQLDFSLALSGHPAKMPPPDVNRKEMEQKGLAVTQTLTAWVGPWGISYAANITSDPTGIGNWTKEQFFTAIRKGKHKGLESSRMLLPPMPWDMYAHMTDEELSSIYAYLKSTKPIKNKVPAPQPPVTAASASGN